VSSVLSGADDSWRIVVCFFFLFLAVHFFLSLGGTRIFHSCVTVESSHPRLVVICFPLLVLARVHSPEKRK